MNDQRRQSIVTAIAAASLLLALAVAFLAVTLPLGEQDDELRVALRVLVDDAHPEDLASGGN